jgi:uncharacterized protein
MVDLNLAPTRFKQIYTKKIGDFFLFYNPYSIKGMTLLDKKSALLSKHIDGSKKIKDYLELSKRLKLNIKKDQILYAFENLSKHDIINYEGKTDFEVVKKNEKNNILTIWLHLTNQCNFRCTYCFVEKNTKRMNETLIEKILLRLQIAQNKYKFEKIKLVLAGGEPLFEMELIKKIIEKVRLLDKNNQIFEIGIITNGSLLTEQIAEYCRNNNIKISISLDGIGKINDSTRKLANGSGTFRHIKKGIDTAQKFHILSGICSTITSKNIKNLPYLAKYCLKNNIKMYFQFYRKMNRFCDEQLITNSKIIINYCRKLLKIIYSFYDDNKILQSPLSDHQFFDLRHFPIGFSEYSCNAGTNFFSITPEGAVEFCPSSKLNLANLDDENIILKARNTCSPLLKKMSIEKLIECQKCLWKYTCSGGCILERLYLNKNKPTYKCDLYKALIPMILDFEAERMIKKSLLSIVKN